MERARVDEHDSPPLPSLTSHSFVGGCKRPSSFETSDGGVLADAKELRLSFQAADW